MAKIVTKQYIVAIGVSAYGLEAITSFFDQAASGDVSYILISHLSPFFKTQLSQIIAGHTKLKIVEAADQIKVEPNVVYLISSDNFMVINEGRLVLPDKQYQPGTDMIFDLFFASLAKDQGEKAIGVILSGTGTDGLKGVEAIRKSGGLVIVQDPEKANLKETPQAAIAAGRADIILSPKAMPEFIEEYVNSDLSEVLPKQLKHEISDDEPAMIISLIMPTDMDQSDVTGAPPVLKEKKQSPYELLQLENGEIQSVNNELHFVNDELQILNQKQHVNNQSLDTSNKSLLRINADLNNFVYSASHDLNAPIVNIEALVAMLMEKTDLEDPEVIELSEVLHKAIFNFKAVISDLSKIGQMESEVLAESPMENFADIFNEVTGLISEKIKFTHVIFNTDFKERGIKFSKKNLRSIVLNLITNAIKFSVPGRVPQVTIKTEKVDGFVLLTVKDNGIGMSEKQIAAIFGMYKRVNEATEGQGIGLYLVKKIVDATGGKIEVESEPGTGSTFKIFFNV